MGALDEIIQLIPGYDPVATAGDCVFDEKAAQLAIDFFPECLKHVKGELAGQPFILGPWEQAIIANLFGWKRSDGTRRYRKVFVEVARKNGKTTLAAGIVIYVLFCDGEPGAEIYSAAADRDQAALVFQQAAGMVRQDSFLFDRATIFTKAIVLKDQSASYKPISSDANTKFGYNTSFAVVDEVHAHKTRDLIDALDTSTAARRQPIMFFITTRDWDHPSICNEIEKRAIAVRDGVIEDPSMLPALWIAPRDADWTDEKVWALANPNLGVSVKIDDLREKCLQAKESPAFENTFKRMHLNMKTEQATRWLSVDKWDACVGEVDEESLIGMECFGGLDLASTRDLCAFVLYFPEGHQVLAYFWVPGDNAQKRERKDGVPYETWAREGFLELTEGDVADYDLIEERAKEAATKFKLRQLAIDRWNSAQITTHLIDEGIDVVPFGQGFQSMSYPTKEVEKLVLAAKLQHGGHPVLRWNASNVAVTHKRDAADNIKPDKDKSTEKIDGIVALVMAVGLAMAAPATAPSRYDTEGVFVVG